MKWIRLAYSKRIYLLAAVLLVTVSNQSCKTSQGCGCGMDFTRKH